VNVKATANVPHGLSEVTCVVSAPNAGYFNRFGHGSVTNSDRNWSVVVEIRERDMGSYYP
jgi:hypothetical protein